MLIKCTSSRVHSPSLYYLWWNFEHIGKLSEKDVHNACALKISTMMLWNYLEETCKVHLYEKYLYNKYINTMFHLFDGDVHLHTILINVHVPVDVHCICGWEHEFKNESKSSIAVCCKSVTQKSDESLTCIHMNKVCVELTCAVWKRSWNVWHENVLDWWCKHCRPYSLGDQARNYNEQICHFLHHIIKEGFCKGIVSSVIKHVEQSAVEVNGVISCKRIATHDRGQQWMWIHYARYGSRTSPSWSNL